ncbi:MAG: hypothetical protein JWP11_3419 [Frankiales bacterium]|nr:hypothetical protein [Frankiales bacterium]
MSGVLVSTVKLKVHEQDPAWLRDHELVEMVTDGDYAGALFIRLEAGSTPPAELAWLVRNTQAWDDGVVPARPGGLADPVSSTRRTAVTLPASERARPLLRGIAVGISSNNSSERGFRRLQGRVSAVLRGQGPRPRSGRGR